MIHFGQVARKSRNCNFFAIFSFGRSVGEGAGTKLLENSFFWQVSLRAGDWMKVEFIGKQHRWKIVSTRKRVFAQHKCARSEAGKPQVQGRGLKPGPPIGEPGLRGEQIATLLLYNVHNCTNIPRASYGREESHWHFYPETIFYWIKWIRVKCVPSSAAKVGPLSTQLRKYTRRAFHTSSHQIIHKYANKHINWIHK